MSKYISPVLKPINRHITIVPHPRSSKQDSDSTVLLPEDFAAEDERYITATVLDIAADCSPALRELRGSGNKNRTVVVERSMVAIRSWHAAHGARHPSADELAHGAHVDDTVV